jgi:hypothetical protein
MEYYLLLGFLLFIALFAHIIIAFFAHTLLEDTINVTYKGKDIEWWYKPKYKKYLLIPGVAEVALILLFLGVLFIIMYASIMYFFED